MKRIPPLQNRDFEPTYLENGAQCPARDHKVNEPFAYGKTYCDNCNLCRQQVFYSQSKESCGVMCMWRKDPPFEPLYKVGEERWYLYTYTCPVKKKIRKVEWSPEEGCWVYTFAREYHAYKESHVFNTRKEIEDYVLLYKTACLLDELTDYRDRYGSLPDTLKPLLAPANGQNQLLLDEK